MSLSLLLIQSYVGSLVPAYTAHSPNAGVLLDQRHRRWSNRKPALSQCILFTGILRFSTSALPFDASVGHIDPSHLTPDLDPDSDPASVAKSVVFLGAVAIAAGGGLMIVNDGPANA